MDTKNNMILAKFLGWEVDSFSVVVTKQHSSLLNLERRRVFDLALRFDTDWNWIMLVVEKINTIEGGRFTFQIMSMDVEIHDYLKGGLYIDFFSGNTPDQLIKSVYEACVEFVKKYNNE